MHPPPPTARLEFGDWRAVDRGLAFSLWQNEEVTRFLGGPYSNEEVDARIARELGNQAAHGIQYWPLFLRETGEFAGVCGLKPQEPTVRAFEIGFQMMPQFWRMGLARESAEAVIAHAFGTMEMSALFAGHHPRNEASRTLLLRLGFTQIGEHFFPRTGLDHPWHRLRRDEYGRRAKGPAIGASPQNFV